MAGASWPPLPPPACAWPFFSPREGVPPCPPPPGAPVAWGAEGGAAPPGAAAAQDPRKPAALAAAAAGAADLDEAACQPSSGEGSHAERMALSAERLAGTWLGLGLGLGLG